MDGARARAGTRRAGMPAGFPARLELTRTATPGYIFPSVSSASLTWASVMLEVLAYFSMICR